jgi:hypothetical protein
VRIRCETTYEMPTMAIANMTHFVIRSMSRTSYTRKNIRVPKLPETIRSRRSRRGVVLKGFFRERVANLATCLNRLMSASGAEAAGPFLAPAFPRANVRDRVDC